MCVGSEGELVHTEEYCVLEQPPPPSSQDVVDTHPGLSFLTSAPEFHARYVETVSALIYVHWELVQVYGRVWVVGAEGREGGHTRHSNANPHPH